MSHARIAIVGSGPAALMAADVVSQAGHNVAVFEKRRGPGRKILVSGSTGFNISNSLPPVLFARQYQGAQPKFWEDLFLHFSVADWIKFIETELGIKTFAGSSGHYFVEGMRASRFLRAWLTRLSNRGVEFHYNHELTNFEKSSSGIRLDFNDESQEFSAACLALGGGSYEDPPPQWPKMFQAKGIAFEPWRSSNAGFQVAWPKAFLEEAEGQPLKNIIVSSKKGKRQGDVVITKYGMEGMPIYHVGEVGLVSLDLQPNLTAEQIVEKCQAVKENLAPLRRLKKKVSLSNAAHALLFHCAPVESRNDLATLAHLVKAFPLELIASQPLSEAISSAGGVRFSELDSHLGVTKFPGLFLAGEMLDWDVATGGFLIQACASQGHLAGTGVVRFLKEVMG